MKKFILSIPILALASCAGVEGYKPREMQNSLRTLSEMQANTRVFQLTGGRYNPHF